MRSCALSDGALRNRHSPQLLTLSCHIPTKFKSETAGHNGFSVRSCALLQASTMPPRTASRNRRQHCTQCAAADSPGSLTGRGPREPFPWEPAGQRRYLVRNCALHQVPIALLQSAAADSAIPTPTAKTYAPRTAQIVRSCALHEGLATPLQSAAADCPTSSSGTDPRSSLGKWCICLSIKQAA